MATKVLLADDKPTIAKIIGLALPKEDFELESVTNGRDLLSKLEKDIPFVLLLDVALPYSNDGTNADRDGFYVTQYIKKHPTYRKIKIVLLTNAFAPVSEEKCTEYQTDGVLVKPFDPSELRAKLKSLLSPVDAGIVNSTAKPLVKSQAPAEIIVPISDTHPVMPGLSRAAQELAGFFAQEIEINEMEDTQENIQPAKEGSKEITSDIELSPTAQSLADFFASEINANTSSKNLAPPQAEKTNPSIVELDISDFQDAANEWKPLQPTLETNLSEWQQTGAIVAETKPSFKLEPKVVFDTGGSTFQFSQDYLQRISAAPAPSMAPSIPTQSVQVVQSVQSVQTAQAVTAAQAPPSTPEMEALVREEARRICQSIVDKVAWEVIPELAENIIKRELDKVLKALETNPR